MTTLLLDDNNDIAIIDNAFQLADGEKEVEQKVKTILRTIRGECFLEPVKGIPYIPDIMKKNVSLNLVAAAIKAEVVAIESVESLDDFNMSIQDNRVLSASIKVNGNIETTINL